MRKPLSVKKVSTEKLAIVGPADLQDENHYGINWSKLYVKKSIVFQLKILPQECTQDWH